MITVYPAATVITMNRSQPVADAVAVRGSDIVEVGNLDRMMPWLAAHEHTIDRRFEHSVLVPGFIDPHLHPAMAAVLLPMRFITAMEWRLPWGTVHPTTTPAEYDARLAELCTEHADEVLFTWGHHTQWHGVISRARINAINAERPIIVWNRSFHELCMNDAALELLKIDAAAIGNRPQIDLEQGRFFENGLSFAIRKLNPYILAPERFRAGLERVKQAVQFGGHTTIADMAVGIFDFDTELAAMREVLDTPETPFRTELVPHGAVFANIHGTEGAVDALQALAAENTDRLRFSDHIKLFADGAFFAEAAQLQAPGYIDGHHGEWLMTPEELTEHARRFWLAGCRIHVHVCGDLGVELALDVLDTLQAERPRFNHGFTLEHFGFCTPEQVERAARLGAFVSANVYYLHELSEIYASRSVGYERASSMARLGSCFAERIPTAVHSDFTMAPAAPLNSMWVAVNRLNASGEVMAAAECLTPEQGLAAITINAARVIGRENEIGSLRAGKRADITVLAENPLTVDPLTIRDIEIQATVCGGQVFER